MTTDGNEIIEKSSSDNIKLEEQIKETKNSLSTDRLDMSFGEIMSMYEREEIIINPDFQRLFRWSNYQQTRFIESILLGIPIPPIFVAEDNEGKWELVDGLQRISTILSFFGMLKYNEHKNNWIMCEGDLIDSLKGYCINNIPTKFQLNIKRAACRVEIIKWNSKIDMRYELFNRLNTGGTSLTDQEIRNCIFRGTSDKFNNYLKKMAGDEDFIELISPTEKQLSELYLQELVLRFTSLVWDWQDIHDNISVHMTKFMKSSIEKDNLDFEKLENLFMRLVFVLKPLGKNIFRFSRGGFSTSLYDAIMVGIGSFIDKYENKDMYAIEERINQIKDNARFRENTGSSASSTTRVRNRLEIALEYFKR
jgi:hypothetical protein